MSGVVLVNPRSGPDETSVADVRAHFDGHRVELVTGGGVEHATRKAVEEGADFVAVAGGDGTIRCAASVLAASGIPLVPVPAGTRNHFARHVGIETLELAQQAADSGHRRRFDLGSVNGIHFMNNAGIGIYPRIVRRRKWAEKRFPRMVAAAVAAWPQIRRLRRFPVTLDGETIKAWMVFVGNGEYGTTVFDVTAREGVDAGLLDVRVLRADVGLARVRAVGALLVGRVEASPLIHRRLVPSCDIDLPWERADVALDGEVFSLSTPLRFESVPGALEVLTPTGS
jgi:diacylglycerol kinase family enzyme